MTSACLNSRLLPILMWKATRLTHFSFSLAVAPKTLFLIVVVVVNHICLIWWSIHKLRLSTSDRRPTNVNKLLDLRSVNTWLTCFMLFMNVALPKRRKNPKTLLNKSLAEIFKCVWKREEGKIFSLFYFQLTCLSSIVLHFVSLYCRQWRASVGTRMAFNRNPWLVRVVQYAFSTTIV